VDALALALVSDDARGLLASLPGGLVEKLDGMADGADLSFQRVWLAQLTPAARAEGVFVSAVGVLFTVRDTGAGFLAGQTLEWPADTPIAVTQARPRAGFGYVSVGLPWQTAGVCGVNERGLAVAAAPWSRAADDAMTVPAETLLDDVLTRAGSFDEALALLTTPRDHVAGRLLVGFDNGDTPRSAVVEVGPSPGVVETASGQILVRGADTSRTVETRVSSLLRGLGAGTAEDFERIAADRDRRAPEGARVLNGQTRACIVLVPRAREIRVMAPDRGGPREYRRVRAGGDES
jgi:hypothetical protein